MVTKSDIKSSKAKLHNAEQTLKEAKRKHSSAKSKYKKAAAAERRAKKQLDIRERVHNNKKNALANKISSKIKRG